MLLCATTADAQIFRQSLEPTSWFSFGAGTFSASEVHDEKTATTWDFGSGTSVQYRASLEKAWRNQTTFGITATYVRAPITYTGTGLAATPVDADVDVIGLFGTFHIGGGPGLHQVIEASAGATRYQNFKRESDGADLPPDSDTDFSFNAAYGFGYTLNPRAQVNLVQEYGFNFHGGGSGGASNTLRTQITRLTLRLGIGGGGRGQPPRRRR